MPPRSFNLENIKSKQKYGYFYYIFTRIVWEISLVWGYGRKTGKCKKKRPIPCLKTERVVKCYKNVIYLMDK